MENSLFHELKTQLIVLESQRHCLRQFGSDLKIINIGYGAYISLFSSLKFRHLDESCVFNFSIVE